MARETISPLVGEWKDTIYDAEGNLIKETPWRKNQIQNTAGGVLMALLGTHPTWGGLQYLAIGEGDPSWDVTPPSQSHDATILTSEIFRKAIGYANVTFRDPSNPDAIVADPSRVMQLEVEFGAAEANGIHREFALFGGDATAVANTGQIFNWVVTLPRIEKIAGTILRRQIRLTYPAL